MTGSEPFAEKAPTPEVSETVWYAGDGHRTIDVVGSRFATGVLARAYQDSATGQHGPWAFEGTIKLAGSGWLAFDRLDVTNLDEVITLLTTLRDEMRKGAAPGDPS